MSMTVTTACSTGSCTEVSTAMPSLVLRLHGSAKDTLEQLHAEIQQSLLLPSEMLPEVSLFSQLSLKKLGFFILNTIEPAIICYEKDFDAQEKLLAFHERLLQIIKDRLPAEITIEVFLKKCVRRIDKAIKKELLRSHLKQETQKIYAQGNALNQLNLVHHQAVNNRAAQINTYRMQAMHKLHKRLQPLERRMEAIFVQATHSVPEIQTFCKKLEEQDIACRHLLDQCETTVKGVPT